MPGTETTAAVHGQGTPRSSCAARSAASLVEPAPGRAVAGGVAPVPLPATGPLPAGHAVRPEWRRHFYKRPFDLTVTALALAALWPLWLVLGIAAAAAIRLEDGGPVLYRQARLGRGGRVFRMLKFRSMTQGAEERTGTVRAGRPGARCTAAGRVLRRLHIDELPQVVHVLRGEMSLVGPRPERPGLAARIGRALPGFSRRLAVRPGIAGLAQARAGRRISPRNKLRYDLVYIGAMGPWLDLKLCAACVRRALRG